MLIGVRFFDVSEDIINLPFASGNFSSLSDVSATDTSQNGEAGVLIALGVDESVFIVGIRAADLTESNFIF